MARTGPQHRPLARQKVRQPQSGRAPVPRVWSSSKRQEERPPPHQQGHCFAPFLFVIAGSSLHCTGLSCPAARGIPGLQLIMEAWGATQPPPQTHLPPGRLLEAPLWGLHWLGARSQNTSSGGVCSVVLSSPGLLSQRKDETSKA